MVCLYWYFALYSKYLYYSVSISYVFPPPQHKNYSHSVCACVFFFLLFPSSSSLVSIQRCVLLFAVASCSPFMPIIRIFYCRHHKHTTANNMLNICFHTLMAVALLFSLFLGCYCGLLCCFVFSCSVSLSLSPFPSCCLRFSFFFCAFDSLWCSTNF